MTRAVIVPYAAAGVRLLHEVAISSRLLAQLHLDADLTLVRASLRVSGAPDGDWTAPPASLGAGLALLGRFW
jgi:hypothetical protein